jgi:hypothetical protein
MSAASKSIHYPPGIYAGKRSDLPLTAEQMIPVWSAEIVATAFHEKFRE